MEDYLGPIKSKPELFLKLVKRVRKPDYIMNIMEDRNGRKAMFYNYKGEEFKEDDCILLKGTIAEHRISTFDGRPLTYINRVTVLKNMGSKKNEKKEDVVDIEKQESKESLKQQEQGEENNSNSTIESRFREIYNKNKPVKTWQEQLAEENEIS
jgi:hypothetical protein